MSYQHIVQNPRKPRRYKNKRRALQACPQRRATCLKVTIMTPRKPNSAQRKVSWVLVSSWYRTWAYIPGQLHRLQKHSTVLIQGGRIKDLPGVKYKMIRGHRDLVGWLTRLTARSKYGVPKARERELKLAPPYRPKRFV